MKLKSGNTLILPTISPDIGDRRGIAATLERA
jgi:hypothetical protein